MTRTRGRIAGRWAAVAAAAFAGLAASAAGADEEHPFILWTKQEAAALRKRIETQEWAKKAYAELPSGRDRDAPGLPSLLRYSVMGDRAAGEAEKKLLLGRGRGRYMDALRYDIVYDLLTAEERQKIESSWRQYVEGAMVRMAERRFTRWNWLPNLGYPWYLQAHLMAVAMRDRALARKIFAGPNGLKWYLDEYLSDLGFYNEEFGKAYNTPDAILLWGRACKRLGLNEIGFGYKGRQGATIRGHIESFVRIGYPRVDLGTARAHYPRLSIGDARGGRGFPAYGFQHANVAGFLLDGRAGGEARRHDLGFWCWFELAHAEWPDAGFGYFLAQRRGPEEDRYYPTLYFGLEPIEASSAAPPAPSGAYPGRGLVMLRAEETSGYWEGPGPAVGMRLATPYAHHIQDCFCLAGFYAHNRPIFVNHSHATNYTGVDPGYSNSSRSHSTVIVDNAEPKTIGEVPTRHDFGPLVKFAAARGRGIYEGVDQTRALMLTGEYLLDVFHVSSRRPRLYQWIIHTLGNACPGAPGAWARTRDLSGTLVDLGREWSLVTDGTWSVTAVQSSGGANRAFSGFGERWFTRRVGVRTTMLGEAGTTAYHAWAPVVPDAAGHWAGRDRFAFGEDEPAGVAIVAVRRKPATTFVAVHEPFEGTARVWEVRRIAQTADAVCLRVAGVAGGGIDDRLMLRLGDEAGKPIMLAGEGEAFRFVGHAFVRAGKGRVDVAGKLLGMRLRVGGAGAKVFVNGKEAPAQQAGGVVMFGQVPPGEGGVQPVRDLPPGLLAARWLGGPHLCVPTGGGGKAVLRLRSLGPSAVTGRLALGCPAGLSAKPQAIELKGFAPGAERDVAVSFDAAGAARNRLLRVRLELAGAAEVQQADLLVAHGVVNGRIQEPVGFSETIYSPRYVAKYYYMDSTGAGLLLDPAGCRRSNASMTAYPNLVRRGKDSRGSEGWIARKPDKFPYFVPVLVGGDGGRPANLYEAGRHAHGTQGGLEHWFTEDWIVVRYRNAAKDERIAFDWLPDSWRNSLDGTIIGRRADLAAEKMPGRLIVATADGKRAEAPADSSSRLRWPNAAGEVAAVFHQPPGYEHGSAMFYPPGSKLEGRYVTQPGDKPMGFCFCTAAEFDPLLKKWQGETPTGIPRPAEVGAYNGAFMPHLEKPE